MPSTHRQESPKPTSRHPMTQTSHPHHMPAAATTRAPQTKAQSGSYLPLWRTGLQNILHKHDSATALESIYRAKGDPATAAAPTAEDGATRPGVGFTPHV